MREILAGVGVGVRFGDFLNYTGETNTHTNTHTHTSNSLAILNVRYSSILDSLAWGFLPTSMQKFHSQYHQPNPLLNVPMRKSLKSAVV